MVTFYPSGNLSGLLVRVDDRQLSHFVFQMRCTMSDGMQATYLTYFRRQSFIYEQQQSRFHPNVVGVILLIHQKFLKGVFYKPCEQWWIVEMSILVIGHTCFVLIPRILIVFSARFLSTLLLFLLLFLSQFLRLYYYFPLFFSYVRVLKFLWAMFSQQKLTFISIFKDMKILYVLFNEQGQVLAYRFNINRYSPDIIR